jgi:hypothetical protein
MSRILRSIAGNWSPRTRYSLFIDGEGEGDEGAGEGSGGQVQVEGEQGDQSRAASDKGEQMIPKSRFDEINNVLKQYKALGDIQGIQRMRERMEFMEKNPGKRYTDKEITDIENELTQVPAVAQAIRSSQRFNAYMERQTRNYTSEGTRQTEGFLKDMGRDVTDRSRVALTNALCGIIQSDEALMERFMGHDPSVFKEAFKYFQEGVSGGIPRKVPGMAEQQKKAGSKPGTKPTGGQPQKSKEPQSERDLLDEAGEAAFDTLLASEGS